MKNKMINLFKAIKVKSKSSPGVLRIVELYSDGNILCSCPAKINILCRHRKVMIRELIRIIQELKIHQAFDLEEAKSKVAKKMPLAIG